MTWLIYSLRTWKNKRDKESNIAENPKYDGYQRGLAPLVYNYVKKQMCYK